MITLNKLGKVGKAPQIWYEVNGYVVTITELAEIFKINHVTLRSRIRSGWYIAPACLVDAANSWNSETINQFAKQHDYETEFKTTLLKHFGRPTLAAFKK